LRARSIAASSRSEPSSENSAASFLRRFFVGFFLGFSAPGMGVGPPGSKRGSRPESESESKAWTRGLGFWEMKSSASWPSGKVGGLSAFVLRSSREVCRSKEVSCEGMIQRVSRVSVGSSFSNLRVVRRRRSFASFSNAVWRASLSGFMFINGGLLGEGWGAVSESRPAASASSASLASSSASQDLRSLMAAERTVFNQSTASPLFSSSSAPTATLTCSLNSRPGFIRNSAASLLKS